jgi:hypothetical protein
MPNGHHRHRKRKAHNHHKVTAGPVKECINLYNSTNATAKMHRHVKSVVRNDTKIVHQGDNIVLSDGKILNQTTKIKGQYEAAMKDVFLSLGILPRYEALKFEIKNNDLWPPDFITSLFVNGKQVIFEPHSRIDEHYLARMEIFKEKWPNFYLILIKSKLDNPDMSHIDKNVSGPHGKYIDELWNLPYIHTSKTEYQSDSKIWKEKFVELLEDLVKNRADNPAREEYIKALKGMRRDGRDFDAGTDSA